MTNEEVLEIRKRLKKTDSSIGKITGCYVQGADKEIKTYIDESFLNMEDEEQFKYIEIFKKGLSGTLGKNLLNLSFTNEAEAPGGCQQALMGVRASELKNPELLESWYRHVIESFNYAGNYLILLIHDNYDVMTKTKDKLELDESEEVYEYIMCCICPVDLEKPALSYNRDKNCIKSKDRDLIVEMPEIAFLFPAFNDRSTDIHSTLYYVKKTEDLHYEFVQNVLGCDPKLPSDRQKAVFREIVADILADAKEYDTYEVVTAINDTLGSMLENKSPEDSVMLDSEDVKTLLKDSGIKEEHLDRVEHTFKDALGDEAKLDADSLVERKTMKLKTPDYTIQVKEDRADMVEIRMIEGRKYLVIPMDADIEVNGVLKKVKEKLVTG